MQAYYRFILPLVVVAGLGGCGGGSASDSDPIVLDKDVVMTETDTVEVVGSGNEAHLNVILGDTPKDLYLVLSNAGTLNTSPDILVSGKQIASDPQVTQQKATDPSLSLSPIVPAPRRITDWHAPVTTDTVSTSLTVSRQVKLFKEVGDSETFYLETDASQGSVSATLQKVVADVDTLYGKKTLNIWVADDCYGSCSKNDCIEDEDIDALADQFLKDGEDNDIYDWVSNVFGEEWGADAQSYDSDVIGESDEIDILLLDIDGDNSSDGGVLGYFYPKDSYVRTKISGSNERVMFYIDAVMFANEDTSQIDWKKETFSTLAHEFQHMIHFYQKEIKKDTVDDIWINEMLSESTEDLIATKIEHTGPRGVDPDDGSAGSPGNTLGRYPLFNVYDDSSLTSWGNSMVDYSVVNSFGAFLMRNYGGAKVLHDILYSGDGHEEAVEEATEETFGTLMAQWGAAVLLSDRIRSTSEPMTYNTGDFRYTTYGESTYKLGSINFYNYTFENAWESGPKIYTDQVWVQESGSNLYYRLGEGLSGTVSVDIESLSRDTTITLITK